MAGWGDDPELERLRTLVDEGWTVVEITDDPNALGGPADTVVLSKDGKTETVTSDHLQFHHYVEWLREEHLNK
jgi:ABC-type hemin transport system ATPase subunit